MICMHPSSVHANYVQIRGGGERQRRGRERSRESEGNGGRQGGREGEEKRQRERERGGGREGDPYLEKSSLQKTCPPRE